MVEVDSGGTSYASVCVQLKDIQRGLDRDIVLLLTTADGTASGMNKYFRCSIKRSSTNSNLLQKHMTTCHSSTTD